MKRSKKKRIYEIQQKPCGESSPYWNWLESHSFREEGEMLEPAEANPDILSESSHMYASKLNEQENEMLSAIEEVERMLSGREAQVFQIHGRKGYTIEDTARVLNISRESVKMYLIRIRARVEVALKRIRSFS